MDTGEFCVRWLQGDLEGYGGGVLAAMGEHTQKQCCLMVAHRLRRWTNIKPPSFPCLMLAGYCHGSRGIQGIAVMRMVHYK